MDHTHHRAQGCLLGLMIGDALGAGVEGWPPSEIQNLSRQLFGPTSTTIEDFFPAVPMGTYVPTSQPGQYREARSITDTHSFVPTGPPTNLNTASQCARIGYYTDDTNQALALAASIVEEHGVDAAKVGLSLARFFRHEPYRGIPPSAKRVIKAIEDGISADETGLPPYFPFEGGSFANGGAMRIAPLAVAYRNAPVGVFREAVVEALRCTHRHPEAVDFAAVQAGAVRYALTRSDPSRFHPRELIDDLRLYCETEVMKDVLGMLRNALEEENEELPNASSENHHRLITTIIESHPRPGSGASFQIASVHMAPCVLWTVCLYHATPLKAVQMAIALGGDTDTAACMVGAIVGALHGSKWTDRFVGELENGEFGRDYALGLARELACLDLDGSGVVSETVSTELIS